MGDVKRSTLSRAADADARYFIPAHISFVEREDVSDAKSPRSMHATFKSDGLPSGVVRVAASNAIPAPVAPPPITNTSYGTSLVPLVCNFCICCERDGIPFGPGTSFECVGCNGKAAVLYIQ